MRRYRVVPNVRSLADSGCSLRDPCRSALRPGCVKTPERFHADLFRSPFGALRPLGSEKIARNFALRDRLQNFAEFSHSLDPKRKSVANDSTSRIDVMRSLETDSVDVSTHLP